MLHKIEEWKTIEEAPNYIVSDLGRICHAGEIKFIKGVPNSDDYLYVTLRHNGKSLQRAIHRLVGIYFVPNPLNLPEINHKKGIKHDNRATELEWCTKAYNLQHALNLGLRQPYRNGKDNAKKRVKDTSTGQEYSSLKEAALAKGINYNTFRSMMNDRQTNTSNCIYLFH